MTLDYKNCCYVGGSLCDGGDGIKFYFMINILFQWTRKPVTVLRGSGNANFSKAGVFQPAIDLPGYSLPRLWVTTNLVYLKMMEVSKNVFFGELHHHDQGNPDLNLLSRLMLMPAIR